MSKGYMYALEGVIAGLLVFFYLGSIISPPEPQDWQSTSLTRRSGDLLNSVSASGVLDSAVTTSDPEVVRAVLGSVESGMDYSMKVEGVPGPKLDVRVMMSEKDIVRKYASSDEEKCNRIKAYGIPESGKCDSSEDQVKFRYAEIENVEFILIDTNGDGKYNTVNFDFNDDDNYDDRGRYIEGPYTSGDMVKWNTSGSDFEQFFQVGYINDTLTLYNLTELKGLIQSSPFKVNGFTVDAGFNAEEFNKDISSFGEKDFQGVEVKIEENGGSIIVSLNDREDTYYPDESFTLLGNLYRVNSTLDLEAVKRLSGDALIIKDTGGSFVDSRAKSSLQSFLSSGGTVLINNNLSNMAPDKYQDSIFEDMDLEKVDFSADKPGVSANRFNEDGGTNTGYMKSYFRDMGIQVPESSFVQDSYPNIYDHADYNITINGEMKHIRYFKGSDSAGFSKDMDFGDNIRRGEGERVVIGDKGFRIENVFSPLKLVPVRIDYWFDNYHAKSFIGDETVLEVPGWEWNVSKASHNITGFSEWKVGPFLKYTELDFIPDSVCDDEDGGVSTGKSYINTTYTLDGTEINVLLTEISRRGTGCDGKYDYVSFDFTGDNAFTNSSEETPEGFGNEGIYQDYEVVKIDNKEYRINLNGGGPWVYLEKTAPGSVSSAVWNSDVFHGGGDVFYLGNRTHNIETDAILRSALVRSSVSGFDISDSSLGQPNVGTFYVEALNNGIYNPYTVKGAWWFR